MARECGPPSWVLRHPKVIHAETRRTRRFFSSPRTPRLRVRLFGIWRMSPGWPAVAGHDKFESIDRCLLPAHERDAQHVGRAGRSQRHAGGDDDALAGAGEAFLVR